MAAMASSLIATTDTAAEAATLDNPGIPFPIRSITAGLEIWALLDFVEAEIFDEGVMAEEKDRIARSHEPARSEKWQFSATVEDFHYDGTHFSGVWRSAPFQDNYFIEYINFQGDMDQAGKMIRSLRLIKTRFDRTSLVEPLNRGASVIAVRFENLPGKPSLGNRSVVYSYVPGTSKVFIESAWGRHLATNYHSKVRTEWTGYKIDEGPNPVTGQKRDVFANVEFISWGRQTPPTRSPGPAIKTITVKGDWNGLPEIIAWLSERKGVAIIDHTSRVRKAVKTERDLADSGLTSDEPMAAEEKESTPWVLEANFSGPDPDDLSANATVVGPGLEAAMKLTLDHGLISDLGEKPAAEWTSQQTAAFRHEIIVALKKAGL